MSENDLSVSGSGTINPRTNQVGVGADGGESVSLHRSHRPRLRDRVPGFDPVIRRMHTPPPARTLSRPGSRSPPAARDSLYSGSPLSLGEEPGLPRRPRDEDIPPPAQADWAVTEVRLGWLRPVRVTLLFFRDLLFSWEAPWGVGDFLLSADDFVHLLC